MTVRANWHLDFLDALEGDDPMQIGHRVDVDRSEEELRADLSTLFKKESNYATYGGVECDLKWSQGHVLMGGAQLSCFSCPNFKEYTEHPLGGLCKVGREQEDIVAMLQALQREQVCSLEEELVQHFAAEIELSGELAEALA